MCFPEGTSIVHYDTDYPELGYLRKHTFKGFCEQCAVFVHGDNDGQAGLYGTSGSPLRFCLHCSTRRLVANIVIKELCINFHLNGGKSRPSIVSVSTLHVGGARHQYEVRSFRHRLVKNYADLCAVVRKHCRPTAKSLS